MYHARPAFPQHWVAGEQEVLEINQEWKVDHRIWCTYSNFRRACHHAINKAVPDEYKSTNTIGQSGYASNMTVHQILDTLDDPWGIPTPADIMANDRLIHVLPKGPRMDKHFVIETSGHKTPQLRVHRAHIKFK